YQVPWPKRGCWATNITGLAARALAIFRFCSCVFETIFGSGSLTSHIWLILGPAVSSSGSWANASRTRALADISAMAGEAAIGAGAAATTVLALGATAV